MSFALLLSKEFISQIFGLENLCLAKKTKIPAESKTFKFFVQNLVFESLHVRIRIGIPIFPWILQWR